MGEKKKLHASTASHIISSKREGGKVFHEVRCDLIALATEYSNFGNVPKTISDNRAMEIALLSRAYLSLKKKPKKSRPS